MKYGFRIKAALIVSSHLSDIQTEADFNNNETNEFIKRRAGFIKYIIFKLKGNLNKEIDPDQLWDEYIKKYG